MNGNDVAKVPAVARRRLPPRRHSENRRLVWRDQTIFLTVGFDADGTTPKELFYSAGYRGGSDMEALVSDLCVFVSVMLQTEGVTVASLRRSMSETFDVRTGDPMPASILGLLLEELSRPPEWAAAIARAERDPAEWTGISGEAAVDRRPSGGAGRQDVPGPDEAARRDTGDDSTGAASGEESKG